jgi:hypothetical protein
MAAAAAAPNGEMLKVCPALLRRCPSPTLTHIEAGREDGTAAAFVAPLLSFPRDWTLSHIRWNSTPYMYITAACGLASSIWSTKALPNGPPPAKLASTVRSHGGGTLPAPAHGEEADCLVHHSRL